MFDHLNVVATSVFVFFFALVTVIGFVAARWKAADLDHIARMGPGRAAVRPLDHLVPARRRSLHRLYRHRRFRRSSTRSAPTASSPFPTRSSSIPLLYLTMPRLWAVSHKHGYITAGDFVLGRYGNRWLELAVALTGILATMPYIALQLVGMEKVISRARLLRRGRAGACADHHRLRHPRALHLQERPARAGDDRLRQGRDDLHLHHRGDRRHPLRARRLRRDLRRRRKRRYDAKVAAGAAATPAVKVARA